MNPVKESEITMASVEKFSAGAVRNQLRHNCREIEHSSNTNIDQHGRSEIISCRQTGESAIMTTLKSD